MYIEKNYPKSHAMMIAGLNGLSFIVGLAMIALPFVRHKLPGDFDTTVHVAVGALICVLAVFRLTVALGAIWIDIALAILGVITLMTPTIMHMKYNEKYNLGHLGGGGVVMGVAVVSLLATVIMLKKMPRR